MPLGAGGEWLERARAGDRTALARVVTAVENDTPDAGAVLDRAYRYVGHASVVGFTGAPGSGKSTLVGAVVAEARRRDLAVGIIAVDPSSPLSGGAVLGDRIRMLGVASDSGVYMRSLAARGHLGGVSAAVTRVIDVLDAAGKDLIIVETVGVGQSETEITGLAHMTVVVCAPGMGDDVQMIKAGVLEIADVFAVNKADLPEARGLVAQLRAAAHLGKSAVPPIVETVATRGEGVPELLDVLQQSAVARRASAAAERLYRVRRTLLAAAREEVERRLIADGEARLDDLSGAVLAGRMQFSAAVRLLLAAAASAPSHRTDHG